MHSENYTYTFDDVQEESATVRVTDYRRHKQYTLQVSVNDTQLIPKSCHSVPGPIADIVDLALAVYAADRFSLRYKDEPCYIHVCLPVRYPELLQHASVLEQLQEILHWYTDDHWFFTFSKRTGTGRSIELQQRLELPDTSTQPIEVALWSGGLDSLAGLLNRLMNNPTAQFVLFSTGGNSYIHRVQLRVAKAVQQIFSARDIRLIQVPFQLSEETAVQRNRYMRARGFIFLLLGAVCAHLQGQNTLSVYENGVGAINLPFRASEIGLDHARSVHPISLSRMGSLLSLLLGTPFSFHNPFLFWTKAQMCQVFENKSFADLVASTVTCDRRHRQKVTQCGCCSSCLLRRQALIAANISDRTKYVVTHGRKRLLHLNDALHFKAMIHQVTSIGKALEAPQPWHGLAQRYRVLWDIVNETSPQENLSPYEMSEKLVQLYRQYVGEWEISKHEIGAGLQAELVHDQSQLLRQPLAERNRLWKTMRLIA